MLMGHAQALHGVHAQHRMRSSGVECDVQPALGGKRPTTDARQRPLPAAQQAAAREDGHEPDGCTHTGGAAPVASAWPPAARNTPKTANTTARTLRTEGEALMAPDTPTRSERFSLTAASASSSAEPTYRPRGWSPVSDETDAASLRRDDRIVTVMPRRPACGQRRCCGTGVSPGR